MYLFMQANLVLRLTTVYARKPRNKMKLQLQTGADTPCTAAV